MKKNIIALMALAFLTIASAESLDVEQRHIKSTLAALGQIPGWCSNQKAEAMMQLIYRTQPEVCVELGVFAGKSILPTAIALRDNGKGKVYGVDPWNAHECIKHFPEGDPNRNWWGGQNMGKFYNYCIDLLRSKGVASQCIILRETSAEAAQKIGAIDILHIDTMHCDGTSYVDVTHFVPKVKQGGFIWFDGWSTSPQAFDWIKESCEIVSVLDEGRLILLQKIQ